MIAQVKWRIKLGPYVEKVKYNILSEILIFLVWGEGRSTCKKLVTWSFLYLETENKIDFEKYSKPLNTSNSTLKSGRLDYSGSKIY